MLIRCPLPRKNGFKPCEVINSFISPCHWPTASLSKHIIIYNWHHVFHCSLILILESMVLFVSNYQNILVNVMAVWVVGTYSSTIQYSWLSAVHSPLFPYVSSAIHNTIVKSQQPWLLQTELKEQWFCQGYIVVHLWLGRFVDQWCHLHKVKQ